jgi:hypothetical protein
LLTAQPAAAETNWIPAANPGIADEAGHPCFAPPKPPPGRAGALPHPARTIAPQTTASNGIRTTC